VPASSSTVTRGGSGTQPVFAAPSISARRATSAWIASRKRVQSARNSSETKSPGRLGVLARGGFSGCSFGPGITPHLSVETVDKSELVEPQTSQRSGPSGGDVGRDSTRSRLGRDPPKGWDAPRNRRKKREILPARGSAYGSLDEPIRG
jgi:hypothetical protein